MKKFGLLSIFLVILVFFACYKASVEERSIPSDTVVVSDRTGATYGSLTNGRYIFDNPDQFESYVLSLKGQNLDNIETGLNFQSFRKYSNGNSAEPIIDDSYFASVVNRDGILQKGD